MNAPSFTYDNKIITVTHDMTLHITNTSGNNDVVDFQRGFYHHLGVDFMELMHIIFTKLLSKVPDDLNFKLHIYQIPSCMVPYIFAKDAFEILKPLVIEHDKTRYTYERYFLNGGREKEIFKSPFSLSSSDDDDNEDNEKKEKEKKHSMFDLSYSDEEK